MKKNGAGCESRVLVHLDKEGSRGGGGREYGYQMCTAETIMKESTRYSNSTRFNGSRESRNKLGGAEPSDRTSKTKNTP